MMLNIAVWSTLRRDEKGSILLARKALTNLYLRTGLSKIATFIPSVVSIDARVKSYQAIY
jgi:hypothetical protein